jgi:hypothetical protein
MWRRPREACVQKAAAERLQKLVEKQEKKLRKQKQQAARI